MSSNIVGIVCVHLCRVRLCIYTKYTYTIYVCVCCVYVCVYVCVYYSNCVHCLILPSSPFPLSLICQVRVCMLMSGIITLCWLGFNTFDLLLFYAIIFGYFAGGFMALQASTAAELFGIEHLGTIHCFTHLLTHSIYTCIHILIRSMY